MATKKPTPSAKQLLEADVVAERIHIIRGQKVMLDADLAEVYGVTTRRLNEQVKRNRKRFPEDFMFQLSKAEAQEFVNRSQFATGSQKHRDPRYRPYAFTEHGAVMLASVLSSPIAVEASIQVVRAFIKLRTILAAHKELAQKITELEQKYDERFKVVFAAIKQLMEPPPGPKRQIGFKTSEKK